MAGKQMPLRKKRKIQKSIFIVITVVVSIGLIGTSIAWVLGGLHAEDIKGKGAGEQVAKNAEEDLKARIVQLEAQVKSKPGDTALLLELAASYGFDGQAEKSAQTYEKVLKLEPENAGARLNAAVIYYFLNKYDKAEQHLKVLLEQNPDHAEAHYWYGYVLAVGKSDYEAGIAQLEKYIELAGEGVDVAKAKQAIEEWKGELIKQK